MEFCKSWQIKANFLMGAGGRVEHLNLIDGGQKILTGMFVRGMRLFGQTPIKI